MYVKMQDSGPTEIIPLVCISSTWGQYLVFSHPEFPQGSPAHHPWWLQLLMIVTSFVYWCGRKRSIFHWIMLEPHQAQDFVAGSTAEQTPVCVFQKSHFCESSWTLVTQYHQLRNLNNRHYCLIDFPGGAVVKNLPANVGDARFDPWAGKIPWRRKWLLAPVFLLGESYGQRSLAS